MPDGERAKDHTEEDAHEVLEEEDPVDGEAECEPTAEPGSSAAGGKSKTRKRTSKA